MVDQGYPVLVNSEPLVDHVIKCASTLFPENHIHLRPPSMGSEDFSYFCDQWGGVFVELGSRNPDTPFRDGLHSPHFMVHEDVLAFGTTLFEKVILDYL
jgi:metal-dependent amidase/aminoacylase/carboxypeptidase family protein